jgi:hypothetical protein
MDSEITRSGAGELKISPAVKKDDRILPATHWLALFIIPFLVVAAVMLYFWPNQTDKTFAWTIKPPMTPMMLAAAYMGGIYFFVRTAMARRWHMVKVGFPPVTAFATLLSIATIIHWDRFNHTHISFFTWTALYFTTPFLVFAVWLRNRRHDSGQAAPGEVILPLVLRILIGAIGETVLLVSLLFFFSPQLMISIWPWMLTPLTARVMGAMFALPGIVGLGIGMERRWSSARIILESQAFSILMILIAAARARADFNPANIITWLFVACLAGLLFLIIMLYAGMEIYRAARG